MIIVFFIIWLALCVVAVMCVLSFLPNTSKRVKEAIQTILAGFQEGLRQCGLYLSRRKYPVELWKWETMEDEDVCDDCLERASWPPMDIADWMKEGMPRTPEAHTQCAQQCRCHLVPYKANTYLEKHLKK